MIERSPQWYHHLMLSFNFQFVIVCASAALAFVQFMIYAIMSDPVVVFNGTCSPVMGGVGVDGVEYQGVRAQCGDDLIHLSVLESPFLYKLLTTKTAPAILCEKTETEYLGEVSWKCNLKTGAVGK